MRSDGVWERGGILGAGVCDRVGAGVCDLGGVGPGVWERGIGPGVCDLEEISEGAGVCDLVGVTGVAGVVGREDIEADLVCIELNRDKGDCVEEFVLYGVGDGDGETCETGAGVGDKVRCVSEGAPPKVVANAFN